jgi:polysaccharide biosynthesis protein PslF
MSDSTRADGLCADGLVGPSVTRKRSLLARPSVAVLSSFPPRECGIATFARDLIRAVEGAGRLRNLTRRPPPSPWVIAMNEAGQTYDYGSQVRLAVDRDRRDAYRKAAECVNASRRTQVVSVQHEYGLFGGEYGDYLLDFMSAVDRPVVLTMHTVLERPDTALRLVTERLINKSAAVVVLAERAREILATYYGRANLDKIRFIPHGTPSIRREPTSRFKRELGLDGYTVLSTFGLLGPDKGIEFAIRALPAIVARHPDVVYLVLGETHPGQRKYAGESYRRMLTSLVDELGMHDHVRFYNRYLDMPELLRFLQATDVYVMPYLNPHQIVSGTLAYAVACGKSVVATPFVYAREMLDEGRGILAEFRSADALTASVNALLGDRGLKAQIELKAYNHGRRMHWPAVGVAHSRLFHRVSDEHFSAARHRGAAAGQSKVAWAARAAQRAPSANRGPVGVDIPTPAARPAFGTVAGASVPARKAGRGAALANGVGTLGAAAASGDTLLHPPLT